MIFPPPSSIIPPGYIFDLSSIHSSQLTVLTSTVGMRVLAVQDKILNSSPISAFCSKRTEHSYLHLRRV